MNTKNKANGRELSLAGSLLTCALLLPATAPAAEIALEISNLTQGIYFTPLLVVGHGDNYHLFETGAAASAGLQSMAEGGALTDLVTEAEGLGAEMLTNPAEGLLAPAKQVAVASFDSKMNGYLSIAGMILPSNDGFVGLDSWPIPDQAGSYTLYLNAYDAGTEANDELITGGGAPGVAGIPANPGANGGTSGTGVTSTELTQMVHIHRGNVGDTDASGGASDLDSRIHRWINPVAKVVVTVKGDQ